MNKQMTAYHNLLISALTIMLSGLVLQAQPLGDPATAIDRKYQLEVSQIAALPIVKQAFHFIEEDDPLTLKQHIALTEIPAPPFEESERALAFMSLLKEYGVDSIWIDEVGNVLARRKGKGNGRTVVLDAHLDTVFPKETDVEVKTAGDTLKAPGIGDDTRGLAMVLAVARAIESQNIATKADILFVGSVGEEGLGDLHGVKHLFKHGPKIDSWIAIDGGAIGRVNNKALGSYRYRVSFEGPGGHSWGAFGLANPHHALGRAIDLFVQSADDFTTSGPKTSYNVGRIGGGTSINSVPFESWMEIDIRSILPENLDSMESLLQEAVQVATRHQNSIRRLGGELSSKVEKIGDRPSGEHSDTLPLVQRAVAATAYFGKRARLTRGSTNSNIPISLGIPAVTIGRGGKGGNAHALDEWWINEEGFKATQLALLLLLAESEISFP